jgi:hypothetical protein
MLKQFDPTDNTLHYVFSCIYMQLKYEHNVPVLFSTLEADSKFYAAQYKFSVGDLFVTRVVHSNDHNMYHFPRQKRTNRKGLLNKLLEEYKKACSVYQEYVQDPTPHFVGDGEMECNHSVCSGCGAFGTVGEVLSGDDLVDVASDHTEHIRPDGVVCRGTMELRPSKLHWVYLVDSTL